MLPLPHRMPMNRPDRGVEAPQRVSFATTPSFSRGAAEWSRRFHRIAPNRRRIVGDLERKGWGAELKVGPARGEERF
jgi:hypothetical protein